VTPDQHDKAFDIQRRLKPAGVADTFARILNPDTPPEHVETYIRILHHIASEDPVCAEAIIFLGEVTSPPLTTKIQ